MTFDSLLKERAIQRCEVADEEIAEHLRVARHDIDFAHSIAGQDLDWAFTIAYNGILQAALAFMYQKGFRPRGEAKHYNTFRFLADALPDEYQEDIERVQKLRTKRNRAVYQTRGAVSEQEANDILTFSLRFFDEILGLMPQQIVRMTKDEEEGR